MNTNKIGSPFRLSSFDDMAKLINLKRLERETYKFLYLGLIVAVLFHAWILFLYPSGKTKIADEKNIQVELVKVPPKITRPVIIPPRISRPISTPKSTTSNIYRFKRKPGIGVPSAPRGLKNPFTLDNSDIKTQGVTPDVISSKTTDTLNDSIIAQEINLAMPKDTIPFSSEIFVDKGDTRSSKSMIIIPPGDKMAIQGYTHIASIHGAEFSPQDTLIHGFKVLANALKFYTNIDAECDNVWLYKPAREVLTKNNQDKISDAGSDESFKASKEITKYPIIYLSYDKPFKLTEDEKDVLVEYIRSGGFIIIDNPLPEADGGRVENSLKHAFFDAIYAVDTFSDDPNKKIYDKRIAKNGIFASRTVEKIPKNHELYYCFFDFNNGPPVGYYADSGTKNVVEGIYVGERLVGFYLAGYGLAWNDKRNEEQLKLGVNMVVYALKRGKGRYNYFSGEMVKVDKKNPVRVW